MTATDKFTTEHLLVGVGSGLLKVKTEHWLLVAVVWEAVEPIVVKESEETPENKVVDVAIGVIGNLLGHFLRGLIK